MILSKLVLFYSTYNGSLSVKLSIYLSGLYNECYMRYVLFSDKKDTESFF
jgi:hypothetical protein